MEGRMEERSMEVLVMHLDSFLGNHLKVRYILVKDSRLEVLEQG
jgi:hypothetical protein